MHCVVRHRFGALPALVLGAALAACGGNAEPDITPTTVGADRLLFERGTAALQEEDWLRAREYFLQVRDNYPQSQYRAEARIGVADSYAGDGTIEGVLSALAEYQDFLALYPTHPRAAYAQYRLAMVHFGQMRGPERDQSETLAAIREFETFIQRYPNSDLMPEVRTHLRQARDRLSEAELMVGEYYHNRKWWPGAVDRLETILEEDPGFSRRDSVYYYLASSQRGRGLYDEALALLERLFEEYPESEHIADATALAEELRIQIASRPPDEPSEPADPAADAGGDGEGRDAADADPEDDPRG